MVQSATNDAASMEASKATVRVSHNLLHTLLDALCYRLSDVLLPEVRVHTLIALVGLLSMWSSWPNQCAPAPVTTLDTTDDPKGAPASEPSHEAPLEVIHAYVLNRL